jgi:hypothetical protein
MKKLAFIMVLMMVAFIVNAQEQRTPIKVTDLQKSITNNISKDYPGFIIKEANRVVNKGTVCYEVMIDKGTTTETLLYNDEGKFMRKEGMKTGMKSSMKEKPDHSGMGHMAHQTSTNRK